MRPLDTLEETCDRLAVPPARRLWKAGGWEGLYFPSP